MVKGVNGNTYDVVVSDEEDYVKVGDEYIIRGKTETRIFQMAYKMGREHKKMEIRNALGL